MKQNRTLLSLLAAVSFSCALHAEIAIDADVKMVKTLPVGGQGGWDYIRVSHELHELFIPRGNHVMVVDTDSGKTVADWPDTQGVHGVAVIPDKNLGFTSNGRSDTVGVFDLKTNQHLTDVKTGTGPDSIVYDKFSGKVLAFNHRGGTVTFITVEAGYKFTPHEVQVGGALEEGVVDGDGKAFVNVEDKSEVVALDTKAEKVLAHYPLAGNEGPTGLGIDVKNHLLFSGCDGSHTGVVVDAESGKILASRPVGDRVDGAGFDPVQNVGVISCGDGTLTLIHNTGDGKFTTTSVATKPGARTIDIDPVDGKYYLPTAEMIPATQPGGRPRSKPDTFQIIVVGSKKE